MAATGPRPPATRGLTIELFLRLLGVVYLVAFASYWSQVDGLVGSGGILPFHTGVTEGDWVNPESPGVCLVDLTSHMHKRGILFTEEYPVGSQIYTNSDWDHPYVLGFPSPLWIPQNDVIHYECTHDNGFSNPNDVKRNTNGIPAKLHFGLSADDEMCIMPGLYFVPAVAGNCTLP